MNSKPFVAWDGNKNCQNCPFAPSFSFFLTLSNNLLSRFTIVLDKATPFSISIQTNRPTDINTQLFFNETGNKLNFGFIELHCRFCVCFLHLLFHFHSEFIEISWQKHINFEHSVRSNWTIWHFNQFQIVYAAQIECNAAGTVFGTEFIAIRSNITHSIRKSCA